jgi:hypothetical protein
MAPRDETLARLAREESKYTAEMAAQLAEEERRGAAWEADDPATRTPFFVPYGLGWDRYAK